MASPEVDPLANSDVSDINSSKSGQNLRDSFEMPSNLAMLSESDLNLIKKMQMMGSIQPTGPKQNGRPVVVPKNVPEILCTCPQKCDEKIPLKVRTFMFKYYHALCRDRPKQEMLLLRFIEMKSLAQRLKEDNKRVQCRYKAPTNMKAIDFIFEDDAVFLSEEETNENEDQQPNCKKPKLDNENSKKSDEMIALKTDASIRYRIDKHGCTEVCQKAFMNVFLVPEKRVRAVREKLVASKRVIVEQEMAQAAVMNSELETAVKMAQDLAAGCKPLLQMLQANPPKLDDDEGNGYNDISSQLLNAIDSDIELVNNFFYNQLWKPEMFEGFATPKNKVKRADNTSTNGKQNATPDSTLNSTGRSMNNTLLDETFDSVINASASMQDETEANANDSQPDDSQLSQGDAYESCFDETPQVYPDDDGNETEETRDFSEKDPLEDAEPDSPEDLEVATANASALLNNTSLITHVSDEPLNLNIASSRGSPDSTSSRNSLDSSISKNSSNSISINKYGADTTTAIDLSVPSLHRKTSAPSNTSSAISNSSSYSSASSKSKSSHRNGQHRSEPMRQNSSKSSPSIQNILNNFFLPSPSHLPPSLFDPDLSKYISGLESSISITANGSGGPNGSSGRSRHSGNTPNAAQLTAQLIQNALNQSSLSVTAPRNADSSRHNERSGRHNEGSSRTFSNHHRSSGGSRRSSGGTKYTGSMLAAQHASTLNQLLNIPDSVSITPTLVDNSNKS